MASLLMVVGPLGVGRLFGLRFTRVLAADEEEPGVEAVPVAEGTESHSIQYMYLHPTRWRKLYVGLTIAIEIGSDKHWIDNLDGRPPRHVGGAMMPLGACRSAGCCSQ